jgi:hypothetical protein
MKKRVIVQLFLCLVSIGVWRIDELPIKVDTSKINKVVWGD